MSSDINQTNIDDLTTKQKEFDTNLIQHIKKYFEQAHDVVFGLEQVRIANTLSLENGQEPWPLQSMYVPTDVVISLYSSFLQMIMQQNPGAISEEELQNSVVYVPSTLSVLAPWEKTRNIIHINNKELPDSLLDCDTALLANLPCWALFFNTIGAELAWNEKEVSGIGFARYFINSNDPAIPGALVNSLVSIIVNTDGTFEMGPYLPIEPGLSIAQSMEKIKTSMIDSFKNNLGGEVDEAMLAEADLTMERSKQFFKLVVYTLQNLDKLKNSNGALAQLNQNPSIVKIKDKYRIVSCDTTNVLYLD